MSEAFEAACKEQPGMAPEVIAQLIIVEASTGEIDPVRLLEAALFGLAGKRD